MNLCETCVSKSDLTGKLVFLELNRDLADSKQHSGYYNGEWFVLKQTPFTLYCVKMVTDVYHGRYQQQFSLKGPGSYIVVEAADVPKDVAAEHARELWYAACAKDRGEKLSWVEGVYNEAKDVARKFARIAGITLEEPRHTVSPHYDERLAAVERSIRAVNDRLDKLKTI